MFVNYVMRNCFWNFLYITDISILLHFNSPGWKRQRSFRIVYVNPRNEVHRPWLPVNETCQCHVNSSNWRWFCLRQRRQSVHSGKVFIPCLKSSPHMLCYFEAEAHVYAKGDAHLHSPNYWVHSTNRPRVLAVQGKVSSHGQRLASDRFTAWNDEVDDGHNESQYIKTGPGNEIPNAQTWSQWGRENYKIPQNVSIQHSYEKTN